MNIERLELLATVLEQQTFAAPAAFHLDHWLKAPADLPSTGEVVQLLGGAKSIVVDPVKVQCGAAACACGHAALMPEFQSQGLKLVVPVWGARHAQPFYEGREGWAAIENFFGLNDSWAQYLFNAESYDDEPDVMFDDGIPLVTPDMVAKRIRALVSDERISIAIGLGGAQ
jgi:hypothetical protein